MFSRLSPLVRRFGKGSKTSGRLSLWGPTSQLRTANLPVSGLIIGGRMLHCGNFTLTYTTLPPTPTLWLLMPLESYPRRSLLYGPWVRRKRITEIIWWRPGGISISPPSQIPSLGNLRPLSNLRSNPYTPRCLRALCFPWLGDYEKQAYH